jgi:hypothetical protein
LKRTKNRHPISNKLYNHLAGENDLRERRLIARERSARYKLKMMVDLHNVLTPEKQA